MNEACWILILLLQIFGDFQSYLIARQYKGKICQKSEGSKKALQNGLLFYFFQSITFVTRRKFSVSSCFSPDLSIPLFLQIDSSPIVSPLKGGKGVSILRGVERYNKIHLGPFNEFLDHVFFFMENPLFFYKPPHISRQMEEAERLSEKLKLKKN